MAETKQKVVGGVGVEFAIFANYIIEGMLLSAPTTSSTQTTGNGASDYNVDIAPGLLAVGSTVKEYAAQADFSLGTDSPEMVAGQSRVYDIVAYRSVGDGNVYLKVFKGAAATTGQQQPPTDASIEASLAAGTYWMRVGRVTVNRTGDTTVTQTQDNTVRNTLVPGTVHYGVNPLS